MKKIILALLLFIVSCAPLIMNKKPAEYSLRNAFPNAIIFEDTRNSTFYFVFDTLTHSAYLVPIVEGGNGVGEISMLILVNPGDIKKVKKW